MLFVPLTIYKKCFNNFNVVAYLVLVFYLNSCVCAFSFEQNTRVLHYPKSDQIWVSSLKVVKESKKFTDMKYSEALTARSINEARILPSDTTHYG